MNKISSKTSIALAIVLICLIFIVEFTAPIQSININIGHLQKRQAPPPPPPEKPKEDPAPPPPEKPKEDPPKQDPPKQDPPKQDPQPQPTPPPTAPTPTPDPNTTPPTPPPAQPATSTSLPAPPNPDVTTPSPNPNATPSNPNAPSDPNAPKPNPNAPPTTSGSSPSPPGPNSDTTSSKSTTTYPPGREPCTKSDDPRCAPKSSDPKVVTTSEESELITQPSITPAKPTSSQSQLGPTHKKSTITQFTTYTTTSTVFFPGYTTFTSSKGANGDLTTYATYIPPSTVVVVKKVTSAKVEEIQETGPVSAGNFDLEISVYNLYSVATSFFIVAVTMLYLIVA